MNEKTYSLRKNLGYFKYFKNKIWFIKFATRKQTYKAIFVFSSVLGNVRPAGHTRPSKNLYVARELSLKFSMILKTH